MIDVPHVPWYLDCDPRPAQIEALLRSYYGLTTRDHKDEDSEPYKLAHYGAPARGWGHFLEMRVGKTPTALNEFAMFQATGAAKKLLVVAPSRYVFGWQSEIQRFGVNVNSSVLLSSQKNDYWRNATRLSCLIASYESLVSTGIQQILEDFVDGDTMIVADESVYIKNAQSNMFKVMLRLSKQAGPVRALSGLPAPNAPFDLWSQLRFLGFLDGFAFHPFKHTFTKMGGFKNKQAKGAKNVEQLDEMLEQMCFRAKRRDWAVKLDTDYETAKIAMTPEQLKMYDQMEQEYILWLSEDVVTADQATVKHMKLQQISSGFVYDDEGDVHELVPIEKTPKFKDLVARLDNEFDSKVLIIAHYRATIDRLMRGLEKYKPSFILGAQRMKEMGLNVELEKEIFNNVPTRRVLIGQSKAIKYGHTLMGSRARPCLDLVFFENSYSLDDRAQSEERPQGHGQVAPLHVLDYQSSPVEGKIIARLREKKSVSDVLMTHYRD